MATPLGSAPHPVLTLLMKAAVSRPPQQSEGEGGSLNVLKVLMRRRPPVPVRDETLTREDGTSLRVRIYDPALPGNRAVLIHAHGGGFKVGTPEECDNHLSALADEAGIVVVSVDYRLLPDPYPAALDDMITAVSWVVAEADRLRINPARMAFTGGSAGGNLALLPCC